MLPITRSLALSRPAVNLDKINLSLSQTQYNQTNSLGCVLLWVNCFLFPRRTGSQVWEATVCSSLRKQRGCARAHTQTHTHTQIYQTESWAQFSCLTADGLSVWWASKDTRWIQGKACNMSPQQHNKYGFSRPFFGGILKTNVNKGNVRDSLYDLSGRRNVWCPQTLEFKQSAASLFIYSEICVILSWRLRTEQW